MNSIFTPEDRDEYIQHMEISGAQETGRTENEHWHLKKDGSRFWARGIMTGLRDEGGELRGFAKVLRDCMDRKDAATKLEAAY